MTDPCVVKDDTLEMLRGKDDLSEKLEGEKGILYYHRDSCCLVNRSSESALAASLLSFMLAGGPKEF